MHSGMNLRDAIKEARELGFDIRPINRAGELLFRHVSLDRAIRINARRKDAGRQLTVALRRVAELKEGNR